MRVTAQTMGRQSYLTYKAYSKSGSSSSQINSMLSNLATSTSGTSGTGSMTDLAAQMSSLKANRNVLRNYYRNNGVSSTLASNGSKTGSSSDAAQLKSLSSSASSLAESATKLASGGKSSIFKADAEGKYDMDAITSAVKGFIDDYNNTKDAVVKAGNSPSVQVELNMVNSTRSLESSLNKVGISIGSDNKLSLNESTFKDADISDIKSLFNGTGSYAFNVATKASQIQGYAITATDLQTGSGYSRGSGSLINTLV